MHVGYWICRKWKISVADDFAADDFAADGI
jgi:hypothetical protein